ncbi:cilia- and flagella-associated protein 61 [Synchiropus splendidus]|uniref:cilia- and flagella-associated protein 61 n=1 Tax=Synchiropus splendidus TaxID=270530 RepID=UPI00237D9B70|nr:cilia- and flagella-associated protein 61 [Synchiropus splendidus]
MRSIKSSCGKEVQVVARRSESASAGDIVALVRSSALKAFGRVNVIHLLEKANLAVTLSSEQDVILAHASFLDYPVGDLVDQARWESFLHQHFCCPDFNPLNTLFLHLFVAKPGYSSGGLREILRAVFNAMPELEHICLLSPHVDQLEAPLGEVFQPLQHLRIPGPQCLSSVCLRHTLCPQLELRPARVEDYDDIMQMFAEQTCLLSIVDDPKFLLGLVESTREGDHTAVFETEEVVVGFISVTTDVDLQRLQENFKLEELDHLFQISRRLERPGTSDPRQEDRLSESLRVFCVQFLVIDKDHEMRSADFIPYLFQLYPDLDLCVFDVPTLYPEFPLLQNFLRVPRQHNSALTSELYVFHRAGLRRVQVRPAAVTDRAAVAELVKDLKLHSSLLRDLDLFFQTRRDSAGVPLQAFLVHVQDHAVGIVIIGDEQDMEYIRAHYNIEHFIYFSHHRYQEHALLRHFALCSSFTPFSKHLFRELLRLSHKSCLYHRVYHRGHSQQGSLVQPLDCVVSCAVPVRPRSQIIYPLEELGQNAPSAQVTEEQAPFALSLITRKLTMEPKVTINSGLVVVGASDCGLSFLEALCFCPHLRFNNLTLVSTHGFPGDHHDAGFLSTSHAYSSRDLAQLPLSSCVRVVTGTMVAIDRKSKHICLAGGDLVRYDQLVLCTGLQYQRPSVASHTGPDADAPRVRACRPQPSNLFTLNDAADCSTARGWIQDNFLLSDEAAVVYGSDIDVYTSVQTLLELGVVGSRIHLVHPPRDPGSRVFPDRVVEEAVMGAMEKEGVRVYSDLLLTQMNEGDPPDLLTSVTFTGRGQSLQLPCGLVLNLSNPGVDLDAFHSMNSALLVFDGRLVIDAFCHTNDANIFAAGTLTKFSRCYYTEEWSHSSFNSKEVGQALAALLLPRLDTTLAAPQDEGSVDPERLVPIYSQPKITGGKLPGGFHFLHVAKPSSAEPATPASVALSGAPPQERLLVTGSPQSGDYFCLRLDDYQLVEGFTCLSLQPLPVCNYLSLYGKHQQLLGQLSRRYQQGGIPDLFRFFNQSSCLAVYHDRFSDLEQELLQIVTPQTQDAGGRPTRTERRAAVRSRAEKYLTYNRNLLPMFAYPGQL